MNDAHVAIITLDIVQFSERCLQKRKIALNEWRNEMNGLVGNYMYMSQSHLFCSF